MVMARDVVEILEDALALPLEARAALIDSLVDSLDAEVDQDAEDLWHKEILRRVEQIDKQEVRTVPWSEIRMRLIAKVRSGG